MNGHTFLGVSQSEALEVFSHECNNTYNIIICDGLNKHQHNMPSKEHQFLPDPQFNTDHQDEQHVQHIQNIAYQPSQQIQTQLQQSQQQLQYLLQQQQMVQNISCQALPQPLLQSNSQVHHLVFFLQQGFLYIYFILFNFLYYIIFQIK